MTEKPDLNYNDILNDFDSFCDAFESRAANAFLRGDQNNGRVTNKSEEIGTRPPDAVREIAEPGPSNIPARAAIVNVPTTHVE
jgi:hypothetical protein|tara:strand:- start:157 stop:405 length:249 start_codon:yes stop_codon:yes gene_type:complete